MNNSRKYTQCHVDGFGNLYIDGKGQGYSFTILDLSAAGIGISSDVVLAEGTPVLLDLVFNSLINEVYMKLKSHVVHKLPHGSHYRYGLAFIDLPEKQKVEIDEMLKKTYLLGNIGSNEELTEFKSMLM